MGLRLYAPNAGDTDLIPVWETKIPHSTAPPQPPPPNLMLGVFYNKKNFLLPPKKEKKFPGIQVWPFSISYPLVFLAHLMCSGVNVTSPL